MLKSRKILLEEDIRQKIDKTIQQKQGQALLLLNVLFEPFRRILTYDIKYDSLPPVS